MKDKYNVNTPNSFPFSFFSSLPAFVDGVVRRRSLIHSKIQHNDVSRDLIIRNKLSHAEARERGYIESTAIDGKK